MGHHDVGAREDPGVPGVTTSVGATLATAATATATAAAAAAAVDVFARDVKAVP